MNSPAYGPRGEIQDVGHAASYLGRAQLEQFVLALAVKDTIPSRPTRGFQPDRYWASAARRAALSRLLADKLHPAKQAEAFTGGLLQDLAVPVIAHARSEEYGAVLFTPDARRAHRTRIESTGARTWDVMQTLVDGVGDCMWVIEGEIDLSGQRDPEGPLMRIRRIGT